MGRSRRGKIRRVESVEWSGREVRKGKTKENDSRVEEEEEEKDIDDRTRLEKRRNEEGRKKNEE